MRLSISTLALLLFACGGAAPTAPHVAPREVAAPHCPVAIVETASTETLTACVLDSATPADARHAALAKLADAHDTAAFPAFVHALAWQTPQEEEDAVLAANGVAPLTLDDARRGQAIDALAAVLEHVEGDTGTDNRLRVATLRALGATHDPRATPALSRVALRRDAHQPFLINRLAFEQLGRVGDPASVSTLILGLYTFDADQPQLRANDVATNALVTLGRPALQPLLETLAGHDDDANTLATEYVTAVHARAPDAHVGQGATVACEAAYTLGELGFPEAIDALITEATQLDPGESARSPETDEQDAQREVCATVALVALVRTPADQTRVRPVLVAAYTRLAGDPIVAMQLLVAMEHMYDPALLPFFAAHVRIPRGSTAEPDSSLIAFRGAMRIAAATELAPLLRLPASAPEDVREMMAEQMSAGVLAATRSCGTTVACWIDQLASTEEAVALKAVTMLVRYGRGEPAAAAGLVAALDPSRGIELVARALEALDHVLTSSPAPAVLDAIAALADAPPGPLRSLHDSALYVRARLARR